MGMFRLLAGILAYPVTPIIDGFGNTENMAKNDRYRDMWRRIEGIGEQEQEQIRVRMR